MEWREFEREMMLTWGEGGTEWRSRIGALAVILFGKIETEVRLSKLAILLFVSKDKMYAY